MKSWQNEAIELAESGISWRKVAEQLGVPRTTVSDFLRKTLKNGVVNKVVSSKPKVLIYDIETAPLLGYCWSLWNNNISLNKLHTDWYVMSWAAKWLGEPDIFYEDQRHVDNIEDDKQLLEGIWKLLDECDFVITQNGKKFDQKKLNARFIFHGMKPPSRYRHIDVLDIAKANFGFTSNKLEYMTDALCKKYKKSKHQKYSGFDLWKETMSGNMEAWEEMESYNIMDILSLEELYGIISPWDYKLPNFSVYNDEPESNDEWVKEGYVYTNLGKYDRYTHKETGAQRRGSVNLLTKEKRASLLRNIS